MDRFRTVETEFGRRFNGHQLNLPRPEVLEEGDSVPLSYVFVADDAFAITENLLKHYSEVHGKLNNDQRVFNYRLSKARRVVKNAFSILAAGFRVLQKPILLCPEKSSDCYLSMLLSAQLP